MKKNSVFFMVIAALVNIGTILYPRVSSNTKAPNRVITQRSGQVIGTGIEFVDEKFDQEAKRKSVTMLVDQGVEFFNKNDLVTTSNSFSHTKEFINGELYLFLYDIKGSVIAHGQEPSLLWKNLYNAKDGLGSLYIQNMIKKAQEGGGWVTYEWRGAMKVAYVKLVNKAGKAYIIGTGYYPHSKSDTVVGLVKGAVALFNQIIGGGRPVEEAFSDLSYPLSKRFVVGDLYLYALDFNGLIRAQGDRPGLIGSNAWLSKDPTGKLVNQEIVKKLKESNEGIWVEYTSKNASKKAYAEKVQDAEGNFYFIACGYYPDSGRKEAKNLVGRGYQFMKANGKSQAVKDFTSKRINFFRYGDLFLFVYNMKGLCIAHGGNEEFVGRNQFDLKDEDGRYFIREFIEKAKAGGGWVNYKVNNSFESTYIEKIDLGIDQLIIGCGLFPVSKSETMTLLVKSGAGYLKVHSQEEGFRAFVERDGSFVRGDLFIFVFDETGICYTYGDDFNLIWRNLLDWKDDNGKFFVKTIINTAKRGPSKVRYKLKNSSIIAYVEQVEKNGKNFVIGSSFYL